MVKSCCIIFVLCVYLRKNRNLESFQKGSKSRIMYNRNGNTLEINRTTSEPDRKNGVVMDNRDIFITPQESPAHSRTSSMRSHKSNTGNFLGTNTQSTWLDWSRQRRVSFKQRIDSIEKRQKELDSQRVSTPIRKARKESVMFVSAELEDQHIIKDDEECPNGLAGQDKLAQKIAVSAKKVRQIAIDSRHEVKLSMNQWNTLIKFWEHDLFVRCRLAGVLLSFAALILGTISIANDNWFYHESEYPLISS